MYSPLGRECGPLLRVGTLRGGQLRQVLKNLFDYISDNADRLEPRLKPMIAWVALEARARYPPVPGPMHNRAPRSGPGRSCQYVWSRYLGREEM